MRNPNFGSWGSEDEQDISDYEKGSYYSNNDTTSLQEDGTAYDDNEFEEDSDEGLPYELIARLESKYLNKDGELTGEWAKSPLRYDYYENGQVIEKARRINGLLDGPYVSYYENGQIKVKATYKYDELDGPYEQYYENGQLKVKATYINGERNGPYEQYHENGKLEFKTTYKNGEILPD